MVRQPKCFCVYKMAMKLRPSSCDTVARRYEESKERRERRCACRPKLAVKWVVNFVQQVPWVKLDRCMQVRF